MIFQLSTELLKNLLYMNFIIRANSHFAQDVCIEGENESCVEAMWGKYIDDNDCLLLVDCYILFKHSNKPAGH